MIFVLLYFVIPKFHEASSQFPNHIDLQKVGEMNLENGVYNILKPSIHMVTDYFQDFILRKGNKNFPTKRIFIDKNGFRHYWSGFDNNYRKFNVFKEPQNVTVNSVTDSNNITEIYKVNATTVEVSNKLKDKVEDDSKDVTVKKKPKRKKIIEEKPEIVEDKPKLRQAQEKVMVTTSFFCPFFGVITMNSFLDE